MIKKILISLALAISFTIGFAFNSILTQTTKPQIKMKRVTGIGGIFFKCKDPKKVNDWYNTHLGVNAGQYGASFEWYESPDSTTKATTQWTPFSETTKYFEPSSKDFMINYRVENLEALIEELKKEGVTVLDKMETYDYGKFVHILDPEGNKIELWEPID
jgi:predicted enzyme related to lactoylglutathione lyase